jgi:hypothetical protein
MKPSDRIPDFAPYDLTDGREPLDWESKYPPEAWKSIKLEAGYLLVLLLLVPLLMLVGWLEYPKQLLKLTDQKYDPILTGALAWLAGLLGGTLFDIKWLYHSVAHKQWHLDRRLWRFFTPHLSGGLAFAMITLISSGMVRVFDRQAMHSRALVVGVAFLVGYFSDSAIAKLSEIAQTMFGSSHAHAGKRREGHDRNHISSNHDNAEPVDQIGTSEPKREYGDRDPEHVIDARSTNNSPES